MGYKYTEEFKKKTDTEGTLKVVEILPAKGQSKNHERSIEYDCSIEDLQKGLENLKKARNKSMEQFEINKKKIDDITKEIEIKKYGTEITEEMERILKIMDNHKLIVDLEGANETVKMILEQLDQDNEKVKQREEVLKTL